MTCIDTPAGLDALWAEGRAARMGSAAYLVMLVLSAALLLAVAVSAALA